MLFHINTLISRLKRSGWPTLLILLLFINNIGISQDTDIKSLSDYFSNYDAGNIQLDKSKRLKTNSNTNWQVDFGPLKGKDIFLYESDLISSNYKVSLASSADHADIHMATPLSGYILGDPTSQVRITISDNGTIYGYIKTGANTYFIEPTSNFVHTSLLKEHVIYQSKDILKKATKICAADQLKNGKEKPVRNTKAGDCHINDLAISLDYSYWQLHNGTQGAIDQSIAVMNMVAGSYEGKFADDVRFEIVEHFVSDCENCDPWDATVNPSDLLDDFTSWGPTGFSMDHDLGQFWTNRNLCYAVDSCGVAGLAWIGSVCGTYRYHILEDFTTSAWQLRVLVAHEIGHNFGANHDADGSGHIMNPSVSSDTESWSSTSVNAINTAIAGFTCFENCLNGSCTEILSVNTGNCSPGTVSTYDLTVEIRHGGGGTAASFDLIVDGQSYNQSWSTSPQTVVITGLEATGTSGITVSISAIDGSDVGCQGSDTYDAPSADCAFSVIENFNDCSMPTGWTKASTNVHSWNGGNPLVQYEWKFDDATRQFANYDDQGNASSPLTIDGTCMALMDDDIINHNLYTGEVTLTSAIYDVAAIDELRLKFDYNFHKFEDGGKGLNNSSFNVEVYNGSSWINVLTDRDDTCEWNDVWTAACTDNVDIDVTAHINSAFRVRFIYSDGNDNKWTGMIALDNIEIVGELVDKGPCNSVALITAPFDNLYVQATDTIRNISTITVDQNLTFSAPNVILNPEFSITTGNVFTVIPEGCE